MNIAIDNDGFLADPSDWSVDVAHELAKLEEFDLTDDHMKFIEEARTMYQSNGIVPPLRRFCKDAGVSKQELYDLFMMGPMKLICKFGGLPKPTGCT